MIESPRDRWERSAAAASPGVDELVVRARLLASDESVLNPGGGNFSVKTTVADHAGRAFEVMWVTGWGADAGTLTPETCACLRLDDLRALRRVSGMSDADMIDRLLWCAVRSDQPVPAIETLTHAFVRAPYVDHTHPQAVIALTAVPDGRALAAAEFGPEAMWLDYRQFDADLARAIAARLDDDPRIRFVLMANHGLLSWGDTNEACYRNTLEAAARAATALERARPPRPALGGRARADVDDAAARRLLARSLPALRAAAARGTTGLVARVDRSPLARAFASSRDGPRLSLVGPACPDSLVKTKQRPLIVDFDPASCDERALARAFCAGVASFEAWYERWCREHAGDVTAEHGPPGPRVAVVPGVGVVCLAETAALAELTQAHFRQTMAVVEACSAFGGYSSLTDAQAYADEYWPLMRRKPQLKPPDGDLVGRVAVVSGAASGHGAAIARRLVALDAHVVVAGRDGRVLDRLARSLCDLRDEPRAVASACDSLDLDGAARAMDDAVLAFGGVDALVHVAPSGPDAVLAWARAASDVFALQGGDGAVVVVDDDAGARRALDALGVARASARANAVDAAGGDDVAAAVAFLASPRARAFDGNVLSARAPVRRELEAAHAPRGA